MADTENKLEALEQEAVAEASANPQADAPKKNAVAAEPSHIASMNNAEDLGPAVVKPTDSNPFSPSKTPASARIPPTVCSGGKTRDGWMRKPFAIPFSWLVENSMIKEEVQDSRTLPTRKPTLPSTITSLRTVPNFGGAASTASWSAPPPTGS